MEDTLWYLLASSRGGPTRVKILQALMKRPRNANQLAADLGYDYTTIRHHLDVLQENKVVRSAGSGYGDVYLLSDIAKADRETVDHVIDTVQGDEE